MSIRKRKPLAKQRRRPLKVLTTEAERVALDRAAALASLDTSTWVRSVALKAASEGKGDG